jgi:acyl transferase domain-containing protein/acyl carrier protein
MRAQEIRAWLAENIGSRLGIARSDLDCEAPFELLGLDSAKAVAISGELEQLLDRRLSPTLAYEYPNINALAAYLAGDEAGAQPDEEKPGTGAGLEQAIAIVGIGCRFPGACGPEEFWELLRDGRDAISEVPGDRWNASAFYDPDPTKPGKAASRWGGFVDAVDRFDAAFFGIRPIEAERMDPQQRMLLEVTWEALEDAGIVVRELAGLDVGTFVGISLNEYSEYQFADVSNIDGYAATANALSVAANRLAYVFNFRGPSMAVDTACSSSLVAVHLACQSLRLEESSLAVAAGVNLVLTPRLAISLSKAGAIAGDGRCKPFDARADGYVRAEGCGVVVLKPLSRAVADGDRIYAVIRGSAVNQDGRTNGLTAPNAFAQQELLRRAYRRAGVSPAEVQYCEMHGTGTQLGDPIEATALSQVVRQGRSSDCPCRIGSVKSNIGHLEAAAGIAGLIKAALCLHHRILVPSLHFARPNPHIPLASLCLQVQTEAGPWPRPDQVRRAGVSSFGFGGTNAHVVVEEAPLSDATVEPDGGFADPPWLLLPLSAASEGALERLEHHYSAFLARSQGELRAIDVAMMAGARRSHHPHRLALVHRSSEPLSPQLETADRGQAVSPDILRGRAGGDREAGLVFLYPGAGADWGQVGRQLFACQPVFRQMLERCDETFTKLGGPSVVASMKLGTELGAEDESQDGGATSQPLAFAMQVALTALWRSWGIDPHAVVGHSSGEIAASHAAGALSLEDAARVVLSRSELVARIMGTGRMLVAAISEDEAHELIRPFCQRIVVAATNSAVSTVLSGDREAIEHLQHTLTDKAYWSQLVRVGYASHSPAMEPLAIELAQRVCRVRANAPTIAMFSSVYGRQIEGAELTAHYWGTNLRAPVRFSRAIAALVGKGFTNFLEISSHPVLLGAAGRVCTDEGEAPGLLLSSLHRDAEELQSMLRSLGTLYAAGWTPNWQALYPRRGKWCPLPRYPWGRERFWFSPAKSNAMQVASHEAAAPSAGWQGPVSIAQQPGTELWNFHADVTRSEFLADHRINGAAVYPASAMAEAIAVAARRAAGVTAVEIRDLSFASPIVLDANGPTNLQLGCTAEADEWTITLHSRRDSRSEGRGWRLNATATTRISMNGDGHSTDSLSKIRERCGESVSHDEFYARLRTRGLEYGPAFRGTERIWRTDGECLAEIVARREGENGERSYAALLDSAFQSAAATRRDFLEREAEASTFVPARILSLRAPTKLPSRLYAHAIAREPIDAEGFEIDIRLLDPSGELIGEVAELGLKALRQAPWRSTDDDHKLWFYETEWQQASRTVAGEREPVDGRWLVFADRGDVARQLAEQLNARGASCVVVSAGTEFRRISSDSYVIDPNQSTHAMELLRAVTTSSGEGLRAVIHLFNLDDARPDELTPSVLTQAQLRGPVLIVELIRALSELGTIETPRLFLVTAGSQSVRGEAPAIAAAPLFAIGKVATFENPALRCKRIDLDPDAAHAAVSDLVEEIVAHSQEDEVAFRGGLRFVPTLARTSIRPALSPRGSGQFRADASYLVTGGLGGLGMMVCEWMVAQGARHLILVGRRGPGAKAQQQIDALTAAGIGVRVIQADVADLDNLQSELAMARASLPPLRGIVHAAGVLDDAALIDLDRKRVLDVLAPKTLGAWATHAACIDARLDFFLMFSSAASVLGSPGQASYVAANAFLDAFGHYLRSLGRPAIVINWGPWGTAGMVAERSRAQEQRFRGISFITPKHGLATLQAALERRRSHLMVLPFDLADLLQFYPSSAGLNLFRNIIDNQITTPRGVGGNAEIRRRRNRNQDYVAPRSDTERIVAGIWQRALGIERVGVKETFFELGGDSVFANQILLEIHRSFGVSINPRDAFEAFTIERLAAMIDDRLIEEVESMSDEEVERVAAASAPLFRTNDDDVSCGGRDRAP